VPGVRLLIVKDDKVLITKEYRYELNEVDYRLPGGKVFDRLNEYVDSLNSGKEILESAIDAAKIEAIEETGLRVKDLELIKISKAGATVEWDLYYFLIKDFEVEKQELGLGENIEVNWYSFDDVKTLCLGGKVSEDRTLGVLLSYVFTNQ
jgi:8-oxo-dGTP pyrophosphatase MutT (NUDIX family)